MELTNVMRCCDGCGDELPRCEPTRQPSLDLVGAWKLPKKQTSHEAFLNCIREAKIKRKEERIKSFIQNKKNKFLRAQYCSHLKEVNRLKRVKLRQYCERMNIYNAFVRETEVKTSFPDPFKVPIDVLKPTIKFPYNYPRLGKIPSLQIHKNRCANYLGPRDKGSPITKVVSQTTSKVDIRPSRSGRRKPQIQVRGSSARDIVVSKSPERYVGHHDPVRRKPQVPVRDRTARNVEVSIHPEQDLDPCDPCGFERHKIQAPITDTTERDVEVIVHPKQDIRFHDYAVRKPHIPVRETTGRNVEVRVHPERNLEPCDSGRRRPHIRIDGTNRDLSILPARDLQPCDSGRRKPQIRISEIETKDVEATVHPERRLEPRVSGWRKPHIPIRETAGRLSEIPPKSEGDMKPCDSVRRQPQLPITETIETERALRPRYSSKKKSHMSMIETAETTIAVSLHSEEICPCSPCEAAVPCDTQDNEVKGYVPSQQCMPTRRRSRRPMIRTHLTEPMVNNYSTSYLINFNPASRSSQATEFPQSVDPYSPVLPLRAGNETSEQRKVPRLRQKITRHESPIQRSNLSPEHNPNSQTTGFHCTNQQKPRGPRFRSNDNKLSRVVKKEFGHDTTNTVIVPAAEANRHEVQGGCWLGQNETPSNKQGSNATKPSVAKSHCDPSSQCKTCLVPGSTIGLKTNELVCPCSSKTHDRYPNIPNGPKLTSPPHLTFSKTQKTRKVRKFPERYGGVEEINSETEVEGSTCLISPCGKRLRRRFIKSGLLKRTLPSMPKRFRCAFPAPCVTLFKRVGDLKVSKSTICTTSKCSKISCPKVRWPRFPKNMKLRKKLFSNSWKIRARKFKLRRPACYKGSCDGIKVVYSRMGQNITNVNLGSCIKESCGKLKSSCSNWKLPSCNNMFPAVPEMVKNPLSKEALKNMQKNCGSCGQISCSKPCQACSKCSLSSCLKPFGRLPTISSAYLKGSFLQEVTEGTKELCSKCGQSSCMKMPSCIPIPPIKSCCQKVKRAVSQTTCIQNPCRNFTTLSSPCLPTVNLSPCVSSCSKMNQSCLPCAQRCKRCTTNVIKNTMMSRCCLDLDNLHTEADCPYRPCQKTLEAGSAGYMCSKKFHVTTTVTMHFPNDIEIENIQTEVKALPCKTTVNSANASGADTSTCPCARTGGAGIVGTISSSSVISTDNSSGIHREKTISMDSSTEEVLLQRTPKSVTFKRRPDYFKHKMNDSSSSDSHEQETGDKREPKLTRLNGGAHGPVQYLNAPKTPSTRYGKSKIEESSHSSSSETSTENDSLQLQQEATSNIESSTEEELRRKKPPSTEMKQRNDLFKQRMNDSSCSDSDEQQTGDEQEPKQPLSFSGAYEFVQYLNAPKTPTFRIGRSKKKDSSSSSSSDTSTEDSDSSSSDSDSSSSDSGSSSSDSDKTETGDKRKPKQTRSPDDANKSVQHQPDPKSQGTEARKTEIVGTIDSSPLETAREHDSSEKQQEPKTKIESSIKLKEGEDLSKQKVNDSNPTDLDKQETGAEKEPKHTGLPGDANESVQPQPDPKSQGTEARKTEIVGTIDSSPLETAREHNSSEKQQEPKTKIESSIKLKQGEDLSKQKVNDSNSTDLDKRETGAEKEPKQTKFVGTIYSSSSERSTDYYNSLEDQQQALISMASSTEELRRKKPTSTKLKLRDGRFKQSINDSSATDFDGSEKEPKQTRLAGVVYDSVHNLRAPKSQSSRKAEIVGTIYSSSSERSTDYCNSLEDQQEALISMASSTEEVRRKKPTSTKLKLRDDLFKQRMNESSATDSDGSEKELKQTRLAGDTYDNLQYLHAPESQGSRKAEIVGTVYSSSSEMSTDYYNSLEDQQEATISMASSTDEVRLKKPMSTKLKLRDDLIKQSMNDSSATDSDGSEKELRQTRLAGDTYDPLQYLHAPESQSSRKAEIVGTIYSSFSEISREYYNSLEEQLLDTNSMASSAEEELRQRKPKFKQRDDLFKQSMNDSSATDSDEQETGSEKEPKQKRLAGDAYDPVHNLRAPESQSSRKAEIVGSMYSSFSEMSTDYYNSLEDQQLETNGMASSTEELRQRKPKLTKLKLRDGLFKQSINDSSATDSDGSEKELKQTRLAGDAYNPVHNLRAPESQSSRKVEIAGTIYSSSSERSTDYYNSLEDQQEALISMASSTEEVRRKKPTSTKLKQRDDVFKQSINDSSATDSDGSEKELKQTRLAGDTYDNLEYLHAPESQSSRKAEIVGTIYSSFSEISREYYNSLEEQLLDTNSMASSAEEELRQRKPKFKQRDDLFKQSMNDSSATDSDEQETGSEKEPKQKRLAGDAYDPVHNLRAPESQSSRKVEIAGTIYSSSSERSTDYYNSLEDQQEALISMASSTEEVRRKKPTSTKLKQRDDVFKQSMNDSSSDVFSEQEIRSVRLASEGYEPSQFLEARDNLTHNAHSNIMESRLYLKKAEDMCFMNFQTEFMSSLKSLLVLERILDVTTISDASPQTLDDDSYDYDTTVREYVEHQLVYIIRRIILGQTDRLLQLLSDEKICGVTDKKFMKSLRQFLWNLMKTKDNKLPETQNCLEEEDVKVTETILESLENVFIRNLNRICLPHKGFASDSNSSEPKPVSGYQTVSIEPWIYRAIMASNKEKRLKPTQIGLLCERLLMSVAEQLLTCSHPDQNTSFVSNEHFKTE